MKKMTKWFEPSIFVSTQFSTTEDKASFANHLLQFIAEDFSKSKFTEKLYRRLSNTFGFIAHYDRDGFWHTYFEDTDGKIAFLWQIVRHPCYGDATCTYSDVEQVVRRTLIEARTLEYYEGAKLVEDDEEEREQLAVLKAKYEGSGLAATPSPLIARHPPLPVILDPAQQHVTGGKIPQHETFEPMALTPVSEDDADADQLLMF